MDIISQEIIITTSCLAAHRLYHHFVVRLTAKTQANIALSVMLALPEILFGLVWS